MVDLLDVITLPEALKAVNLPAGSSSHDSELAAYVTAVSRRLDDLCGPIVLRTVTGERHDGGHPLVFLKQAPQSRTSATSITTLTEYDCGTAQVLTAEDLAVASTTNFLFERDTGIIRRRASWKDVRFGATAVVVTYAAGRYAATASVDAKFKQAAAMMLAHLWRREQGSGTVSFSEFDADGAASLTPSFAVPRAVVELLADEVKGPVVG